MPYTTSYDYIGLSDTYQDGHFRIHASCLSQKQGSILVVWNYIQQTMNVKDYPTNICWQYISDVLCEFFK